MGQHLAYPGNIGPGQLSSSISASGTPTFTVTGWPSSIPTGGLPFVVVIGPGLSNEEKILLSGFSAGTATVSARGWDATVGVSHNPGEIVKLEWDSTSAQDMDDHVYLPARDDHTQYLNVARHDLTARHGPAVVLHGNTGSLSNDDHSQYARTDGTRPITGTQTFNAGLSVAGGTATTGPIAASGEVAVPDLNVAGLTGAVAGMRIVGAHVGAPVTGSFLTNDALWDPALAGFWLCTAGGTPGTWLPPVGAVVGHAYGPAGTTDFSALATAISLTVPVIAGVKYKVDGRVLGTQVTTPGLVICAIYTDDGVLTQVRVASETVPTSTEMASGAATLYTPVATRSTIFTLQILASSGAYRVTTNTCELIVSRG